MISCVTLSRDQIHRFVRTLFPLSKFSPRLLKVILLVVSAKKSRGEREGGGERGEHYRLEEG